jgi:hypothetical protein
MNDWQAIKAHYQRVNTMILAEQKNEWAIDPYAWDNGMIRLTPIEEWLWADIRQLDAVLYPQYPVCGVFVDFGNPVAKVAIECDGAAYHLDKEKDARRDRMLGNDGWRVYRITGRDCRTEFDEATMTPGFAAKFVRLIGDWHGIRRAA